MRGRDDEGMEEIGRKGGHETAGRRQSEAVMGTGEIREKKGSRTTGATPWVKKSWFAVPVFVANVTPGRDAFKCVLFGSK